MDASSKPALLQNKCPCKWESESFARFEELGLHGNESEVIVIVILSQEWSFFLIQIHQHPQLKTQFN